MKYTTIPILTAAAIGLVLSGPSAAYATDEDQQDELERQSVVLKQLDARDSSTTLTTELGKAEAWLERARGLADDRSSRDEFRRTMDRVAAMVTLVEALLDEAIVDAKAGAAQASAQTVEEELAEVIASADALEAKQAELEAQVAS
jgi:signal transduction histidine kinase